MRLFSQLTVVCIKQPLNTVITDLNDTHFFDDSDKMTEIVIKDVYSYYCQKEGIRPVSFLFYEPQVSPNTTVFYTNSIDGLAGAIENRARQLNWEMYYFNVHDNDGEYLNGYTFYGIHGNKARYLLNYQDPKWTFYEEGEPLPFEDTERYKERLKRKRVDKELLLKYMRCAGWDLEDDRFWQPVGLVYRYDQIAPFGD